MQSSSRTPHSPKQPRDCWGSSCLPKFLRTAPCRHFTARCHALASPRMHPAIILQPFVLIESFSNSYLRTVNRVVEEELVTLPASGKCPPFKTNTLTRNITNHQAHSIRPHRHLPSHETYRSQNRFPVLGRRRCAAGVVSHSISTLHKLLNALTVIQPARNVTAGRQFVSSDARI
jgi:hypothetical protein